MVLNAKPILFNTDMARAILANRKTATRRVVKGYALEHLELDTDGSIIGVYDQFEGGVRPVMDYAPYRPGDILYVRETWSRDPFRYDRFIYRADGCYGPNMPWPPSIHMPREAARIFLRVTDVWVERLQDISADSCAMEGVPLYSGPVGNRDKYYRDCFATVWNACYAKPHPIKGEDGTIDHYESYPWEDIQEARTYRGKPWYVIGNPWVWVIEFERISREEVM